VLSSAS